MKNKNLKQLKINRKKNLFNRKNRSNVFIIQAIIGTFNLIFFITNLMMVFVFWNNLDDYRVIITFSLYIFYILINTLFSLIFYFYFLINTKEKKYFLTCIILGILGINLFTSIWFYFNSGLSKKQIEEATLIIRKNRINEIINHKNTQEKLTKEDFLKLETLFKIAENKHEDIDNINLYILDWLISKGVVIDIKIQDYEIIEIGKYL